MADHDLPRLYLITPPMLALDRFGDTLRSVLDSVDVACLRLNLASENADEIGQAADLVREVAHPFDVPVVLVDHVALAVRFGLDGVHLDGPRGVRAARKALGADAIVGAHCGTSRHDGMTAGESGADYVAFGPVGATALGDGETAPLDLFDWWSEMIEVPVVAEGALGRDSIIALQTRTDFLGIGSEIWETDDPAETLKALTSPA